MKKNGSQGYLIYAMLFVLFNSIVFLLPTQKGKVFWVAYCFAVVAFATQCLIWKIVAGDKVEFKSRFLGVPVVYVCFAYLFLQTVVAVIFGFLPHLPLWIVVLANVVILCLSALFIISTHAGAMAVKNVDQKVEKKVFYIKSLCAEISILANKEQNADIKKQLKQLEENLRFSDPMSSNQLVEIEEKIVSKVKELDKVHDKTQLITDINALLKERNVKIKFLK